MHLQSREWLIKALAFWESAAPTQRTPRATIACNIYEIKQALAEFDGAGPVRPPLASDRVFGRIAA